MNDIGIGSIAEISKNGMAYERSRLEAAAYRIAIANTTLKMNKTEDRGNLKNGETLFSEKLSTSAPLRSSSSEIAYKSVYEPSNPLADRNGMVRKPDIDIVGEMTTLLSATRSYEANIRAFNAAHQMAGKAIEIGGRR